MTEEVFKIFPTLVFLFQFYPKIEDQLMFSLPNTQKLNFLYGYIEALHDCGELIDDVYRDALNELQQYEENSGGAENG